MKKIEESHKIFVHANKLRKISLLNEKVISRKYYKDIQLTNRRKN